MISLFKQYKNPYTTHMTELEAYKKEFLEYLEIEKNRSVLTVRNYDFYLRRFFTESGVKRTTDITLPVVKRYRLWLNRFVDTTAGRGLNKRTQNYHMIALRTFLKYLAKMDVPSMAPEKIELGKEQQPEVHFLNMDELLRLLEAPLRDAQGAVKQKLSIIDLRDKAIIELLFSTGLRVSEAANLRRDQINLKQDEFTVRGKGSKLRVVFLADEAKLWLKKYLDARKDASMHVFVSHDRARKSKTREEDDGPLTSRSIERMIKRHAMHAGIMKKITPHTMRHSFATDLLRNGADIRSVQSLLGHSSITTTQIYTHVTDKGLREAHKKFHDRTRREIKK